LADLALRAGQAAAGLAGAKIGAVVGSFIPIPGVGTLLGAAAGRALGSLLGTGASRRTSITPERVSGNRFAVGCTQFGVGSAACPRVELQRWADLSRRKYPNAYRTIFAPLLAGAPQTSVSQLDQLLRTYVSHRKLVPTSAVQVTSTGFRIGAPAPRGGVLAIPARGPLDMSQVRMLGFAGLRI